MFDRETITNDRDPLRAQFQGMKGKLCASPELKAALITGTKGDNWMKLAGYACTILENDVYGVPKKPFGYMTEALDQLRPNEIYVATGAHNSALWGEMFATAINQHKGADVLLDAYARDIKQLKAMDFPLFYRGKNPKTSKGRREINECQIPVVMDGITINPGDYIFGDCDGVVIIPKDLIDEVLDRAFALIKDEDRVRDGLLSGDSLEKVYTEIGAI